MKCSVMKGGVVWFNRYKCIVSSWWGSELEIGAVWGGVV